MKSEALKNKVLIKLSCRRCKSTSAIRRTQHNIHSINLSTHSKGCNCRGQSNYYKYRKRRGERVCMWCNLVGNSTALIHPGSCCSISVAR